jgi:signal transduction histidine kinase
VDGYPDHLQQVFINLFVNAVEAMADGGLLQIHTFAAERKRPGLENAQPQLCAVVEITDAGAGVPLAERERIFEPFYTTKEARGGTGLGLAVSSSIIKEHDGWIEVDDGKTGGAVFRVCIPTSQD